MSNTKHKLQCCIAGEVCRCRFSINLIVTHGESIPPFCPHLEETQECSVGLAAESSWSWAFPVCQTLLPKCNISFEYSTNIMRFHFLSLVRHNGVKCVSYECQEAAAVFHKPGWYTSVLTWCCSPLPPATVWNTFPCSHHCGIKLNQIKICLTRTVTHLSLWKEPWNTTLWIAI